LAAAVIRRRRTVSVSTRDYRYQMDPRDASRDDEQSLCLPGYDDDEDCAATSPSDLQSPETSSTTTFPDLHTGQCSFYSFICQVNFLYFQ